MRQQWIKILSGILAAALLTALAGCGNKRNIGAMKLKDGTYEGHYEDENDSDQPGNRVASLVCLCPCLFPQFIVSQERLTRLRYMMPSWEERPLPCGRLIIPMAFRIFGWNYPLILPLIF